jgi:2,4-dienoyl-CoA reductase-like NADH-dependent reductase (Old Yellow Enzyme family)
MSKSLLFEPFTLRGVTFRNRIGVSSMCQYSCVDGTVGDWHLVHLGSRAVGGAGLVMAEATAVAPEGRISPADSGIWKDEHIAPWRHIADFIRLHGAMPGIQLAHAGWKASTAPAWEGGKAIPPEAGGWQPLGVGNQPFIPGYLLPRAMTLHDIDNVCQSWRAAASRALTAGFALVEIHAAHGYLLNSFLSPLCNQRQDDYGGSWENRTRLLLRITRDLRGMLPDAVPLLVRLSCVDWVEGGWTLEDSVRLAAILRDEGVDLIDCSSGGASPSAQVPVGPGYQTRFAEVIRRESKIPTAAVGMITQPHQAETILRTGQADMILLAREMLRDPYWPRHAAAELHVKAETFAPQQYGRAW